MDLIVGLENLALMTWSSGKIEEALALLEETVQAAQRAQYSSMIISARVTQAQIYLVQGKVEPAASSLKSCFHLAAEQMHYSLAWYLKAGASVLLRQGQPQQAARIISAAVEVYDYGKNLFSVQVESEFRQGILEVFETQLEPAQFEKNWNEGRGLGAEAALEILGKTWNLGGEPGRDSEP